MFAIALFVALVTACGEKEEEYVPVVLETDRQKLSYSLGSDFASRILKAEEVNEYFDYKALADGFENSLKDEDFASCQDVVIDAFGRDFMNPDTTKKVAGSECFGKLNGSSFYAMMKSFNKIDALDFKYVAHGFRDALLKRDTILSIGERASQLTKFQTELQTLQMNKAKELEKSFFETAKALPNSKVINGGIVIETIKEGNGGSPKASDEVVAHYILTNTVGDTLESSFDRNQALTIGLDQVIPGWTMSFVKLKKGGKYRVYIPADLAYGSSKGALCFYVELIDFKSK